MSLVKVKRFAQVTIPADIRRKANLEQGDFVEISYETGHIVITPKKVSDKTVDWARKFDEVLGSVRTAAKEAGITAKNVDDAVKTARKKAGR
ncbi:MAG: AbrB/MazE/SpoVT family DNA-binding domain-containing protein [Deltaproteobacteria bacterium]|nr:AbrB/MazE/SpoVT family DNA-binding domain-containing protein [Deltaproteobacteria bacterium]